MNKPMNPKVRDETFKWTDERTPYNLRVICWYCPKCGIEIKKNTESCEECGKVIDWSDEK